MGNVRLPLRLMTAFFMMPKNSYLKCGIMLDGSMVLVMQSVKMAYIGIDPC